VAGVLAGAALVAGVARAAEPIETRTGAVLDLQAAIADEQRALELLRKEPPRRETAGLRLVDSRVRLLKVKGFVSATPGAAVAESIIDQAFLDDLRAHDATSRSEIMLATKLIEKALAGERALLPLVRAAKPPPAVKRCSDGKDNDRDGLTDWKVEPGCTSTRDVRENTPFLCVAGTTLARGRLVVSGACSGAFAEVEFMLLGGVHLNGRYDVMHAPDCVSPKAAKPERVRCKTTEGDKNPAHLIEARFTTTSTDPKQRVQLRFFDLRKRQILRFVVP
jgi:hypothetical protein